VSFIKNKNNYTLNIYINEVWKNNGITDEPAANTIQVEISRMRSLLKPIGVRIKNDHKGGYRLIDVPPEPRPQT
jgi:DNA-binding winged helix-turn-helix (wHTH) protein